MTSFEITPRGPFSLAAAQSFAGGFAAGIGARGTAAGILMAFPVEGWTESAAVDVWQTPDGLIHGEVAGATDLERVTVQAARSLSLDHDGTGWAAIGERDPVLGAIQARYDWLRPVCFYSAYEAATSFVIGQRIAMRQARVVKERLGAAYGDPVEIGGQVVHPFPRPQRLVDLTTVQGLSDTKVQRVRQLAEAALDGRLDTARLRALPEEQALAELGALPGVGPWTASGILLRGCGVADALPMGDDISRTAVQWAYGLPELPDDAAWRSIAEGWRPYRMWATVLLHMAWRRDQPGTPSYRQGGPARRRSVARPA
jgi:DNA-3-methyladenine glycosylase II